MYILFDIGGTNTRVAASDGDKLGGTIKYSTPQGFDEAVLLMQKTASQLAAGESIIAAAGGISGPFNHERTMLVNAPHLQNWINKPISTRFSGAFGTDQVFLENDSALAALGEATYGAGKGYSICAYLGLGTGVGGARTVNAKLDYDYMAKEPGHMIINAGHTLESYISGTAIKMKKNMLPTDITDPHFWNEIEDYLVMGINNLVVTWSPNIVVIGGTVGLTPQIAVDRLSLKLHRILTIFPQVPKIAKAKLQDQAGLYGALALLRQKISPET